MKHDDLASVKYYRKLFWYNRKVMDSYFRAISKLPWKIASKNMEATHHSIKNIFIHILTVYNGWLNYNVYGNSDGIPHSKHDPDNYHSMKEIRGFMNEVWEGVDKLVENLDDNLLSKKVRTPWMPGSHTLGDVLMQVSLEQAHHLGEIIALFWQLNKEPPEMTWIMNTRIYGK